MIARISQTKWLCRSAQSTVETTRAKRISEPPMVGVPALERWLSGPSSRIACPICLSCRRRMNQGERAKPMNIAVIIAAITRNGTYRSTFSQLSQSASSRSGYRSS